MQESRRQHMDSEVQIIIAWQYLLTQEPSNQIAELQMAEKNLVESNPHLSPFET